MNLTSKRINLPKDLRSRLLIGAGVIIAALFVYSEYQLNVTRPAKMIEQLCDYRDEVENARSPDLDPMAAVTLSKDNIGQLLGQMERICRLNRPLPEG